MAKFRSWNEEWKRYYYFEDGMYYYFTARFSDGEIVVVSYDNNKYKDFDWQKAEQIIEPIDVDMNALGCGLEDLNITDIYAAMEYGFNQALEHIENELNLYYEDK